MEAVCRTGGFSSAADELALTQPAVSAQTRQLESEIGTPPVDHPLLKIALFFRDPLVCIVPKAELRKPLPIHPEDLADRRLVLYGPGGLIRRYIDDWLASSNAPYPNIVDVESAEAQKSFVEAGFGWAIVSEIAVKGPGRRGRFSIAPL